MLAAQQAIRPDSGWRNITRKVPNGSVLYLPGLDYGNWRTGSIKDYSGQGNHGVITGATPVRLPSGLWTLSFNGTSDFVDLGSDASILPDAFTFIVWMDFPSFPSAQYLLGWHAIDGYPSLGITNNAGGKFSLYLGVTCIHYFTPADTTANKWHMMAYTCPGISQVNADAALIYQNGSVLTKFGTSSGAQASKTYGYLGRRANFNYWSGKLALGRLLSRALSASEVAQIWNQERHLFGV